MPKVKDPVCQMSIDPDSAAARADFRGQTYYFCSTACEREFQSEPERYLSADAPAAPAAGTDQPYTTKGGVTAPKFGSAGSGGLEYEGPAPPERK